MRLDCPTADRMCTWLHPYTRRRTGVVPCNTVSSVDINILDTLLYSCTGYIIDGGRRQAGYIVSGVVFIDRLKQYHGVRFLS